MVIEKHWLLYWIVFFSRYTVEILSAKRLIIISTPGHVGSSTLFESLKKCEWEVGTRIYDIHSLDEKMNRINLSARHVLQDTLRILLRFNWVGCKMDVITLVRDPISRALGAVFQNKSTFYPALNEEIDESKFEEQLLRLKNFMVQSGYLFDTVNWQVSYYTVEIRNHFKMAFNPMSNGYGFYQKTNKRSYSILTLEDMEKDMMLFFKSYFNVTPVLRIKNTNETRGGANVLFYKYCKQNLRFGNEIVDKIYSMQFFKDVYGEKRVGLFKAQWLGVDE